MNLDPAKYFMLTSLRKTNVFGLEVYPEYMDTIELVSNPLNGARGNSRFLTRQELIALSLELQKIADEMTD